MSDRESRMRPKYSSDTQERIRRARERAASLPRNAWYEGFSSNTGAHQFRVLSSEGTHYYYPIAHTSPNYGGFCYSMDDEPVFWVLCECRAAQEHEVPCWHAAKVHHRMVRMKARGLDSSPVAMWVSTDTATFGLEIDPNSGRVTGGAPIGAWTVGRYAADVARTFLRRGAKVVWLPSKEVME